MVELLDTLEAVVEECRREFEGFPFSCCQRVTEKLNREHGLLIVEGLYCGSVDPEYWDTINQRLESDHKLREQLTALFGVALDIRGFFTKLGGVPHYLSYDPQERLFIDLTSKQFCSSLPQILISQEDDPRIAYERRSVTPDTTHIVRTVGVVNSRTKDYIF